MLILQPRDWRIVVLRGILAVAFGVIAVAAPELTLSFLIILFGAFILIDGLVTVVSAVRARRMLRAWWVPVIYGSIAALIGVLIMVLPGITALAFLYIIAAWLLLLGITETTTAFRMRRELQGEGWLIAGGLLALIVGIVLAIFPNQGVIAIGRLIGIVALILGVNTLVHGWRLFRLRSNT